VGQEATVLDVPNQDPHMTVVYRHLDMYDVLFDGGGILGVNATSIERIDGYGQVAYGPGDEVHVTLYAEKAASERFQ
jgi:hypothetical protein